MVGIIFASFPFTFHVVSKTPAGTVATGAVIVSAAVAAFVPILLNLLLLLQHLLLLLFPAIDVAIVSPMAPT